jgi:hypothetical protein
MRNNVHIALEKKKGKFVRNNEKLIIHVVGIALEKSERWY